MAKISIDSNIILFSWIIVARFKVIFEQMLLILDQFVVDLFCCPLFWWQLYHRFYLKSPVLWRIKKGKEKKRKLVKTITGLNKLTNNNIIIIIIRTIIIGRFFVNCSWSISSFPANFQTFHLQEICLHTIFSAKSGTH